jgi:hypothetical protein
MDKNVFFTDTTLLEHLRADRKAADRRKVGAGLCIVAGVLGFVLLVLWLGNLGIITPFYTWMATVWN